jgi:hypothetical protein
MKANELRIGNYYYGDVLFPSEYNVITANDLVELDSDPLDDYYQPLPLTEEWLIKFGFIKVGSEWKLFPCFEVQIIAFNEDNYNGVMFYTRTIHTDYTPIYCGNYINYVHQLQNLYFALTNEELTMK